MMSHRRGSSADSSDATNASEHARHEGTADDPSHGPNGSVNAKLFAKGGVDLEEEDAVGVDTHQNGVIYEEHIEWNLHQDVVGGSDGANYNSADHGEVFEEVYDDEDEEEDDDEEYAPSDAAESDDDDSSIESEDEETSMRGLLLPMATYAKKLLFREDHADSDFDDQDAELWDSTDEKREWIERFKASNRKFMDTYDCPIDSAAIPEVKRTLRGERRRETKYLLVLLAIAVVYLVRIWMGPTTTTTTEIELPLPTPTKATEPTFPTLTKPTEPTTSILATDSQSELPSWWWMPWMEELVVRAATWPRSALEKMLQPWTLLQKSMTTRPTSTPSSTLSSTPSSPHSSTSPTKQPLAHAQVGKEVSMEADQVEVTDHRTAGKTNQDARGEPQSVDSAAHEEELREEEEAHAPVAQTAEISSNSAPPTMSSTQDDTVDSDGGETTGTGTATVTVIVQESVVMETQGVASDDDLQTMPTTTAAAATTTSSQMEVDASRPDQQLSPTAHAPGDSVVVKPLKPLNTATLALQACADAFAKLLRTKGNVTVKAVALAACDQAVLSTQDAAHSSVEWIHAHVLRADLQSFLFQFQEARTEYEQAQAAIPTNDGELASIVQLKIVANHWIQLYQDKQFKDLRRECREMEQNSTSETHSHVRALATEWLRAFKRETSVLEVLTKTRSWTFFRVKKRF